jgi:hypothetical protein
MGTGDPKDGDPDGGVNLAFDRHEVKDEGGVVGAAGQRAGEGEDDGGRDAAEVPVIPAEAGREVHLGRLRGQHRRGRADRHGLVTVKAERIKPGAGPGLTIGR